MSLGKSARRQFRQADGHQYQVDQRQRGHSRQHRHDGAAATFRELARRSQSQRAGQSRRYQHRDGGREDERARAGQADAGQGRQRSTRERARAHPQRSRARTKRTARMGKTLPFDAAAERGTLAAAAMAGNAANPGRRRATAHRCQCSDRDARHRSADARDAHADRAQLSFSGGACDRSAGRGPRRYRACRSRCLSRRSTRSSSSNWPERRFRRTARVQPTSP